MGLVVIDGTASNSIVDGATISIVIITLNEERNIAECLESAIWADEMMIVDAQSQDQTVKIAKQYTDKVFVRPWPGFGPQKNFGIDCASSEWIFILDSDERFSPELREEIKQLLEGKGSVEPVAYRVPRRNYYYGRWLRWGGVFPDYQIRLIRKDCARYNDVRIHENLIVDGRIGTLNQFLDHYTERRITDHFKKFGAYTTLAAEQKLKSRKAVHWYDLLGRPFIILLKTYVLKQGFRDGIHGFIVSVFASMYSFVKYCKVWDLARRSSEGEA